MKVILTIMISIIYFGCTPSPSYKTLRFQEHGLDGFISFIKNTNSALVLCEVDLKNNTYHEITSVQYSAGSFFYNNSFFDLQLLRKYFPTDLLQIVHSSFSNDEVLIFQKKFYSFYNKNTLYYKQSDSNKFKIYLFNVEYAQKKCIFEHNNNIFYWDVFLLPSNDLICYKTFTGKKRMIMIRKISTGEKITEIKINGNSMGTNNLLLTDNARYLIYSDQFEYGNGLFISKLFIYDIDNNKKSLLKTSEPLCFYQELGQINDYWISYNYSEIGHLKQNTELRVLNIENMNEHTIVIAKDIGVIEYAIKRTIN